MNSSQILECQFLQIRAKILELAANLDRIDRAEGDVSEFPAMINIRKGIEILGDDGSDRAKQVQLLFSREYNPNWVEEFQLKSRQ